MTTTQRDRVAAELAAAFPLRQIKFSNEILLRPLVKEDLSALTDIMAGDPAMTWTRNTWTQDNVSYLLRLRLTHYKDYRFGMYGVVDTLSGELIGMAGLQFWDDSSPDVEIITYIRRSDWNRGLATELSSWCCAHAFAECPSVERIVAATRHDNIAAQKVARRMAMSVTGEGEHYGARSIFWNVDRATFEEFVPSAADKSRTDG